MLLRWLSLAGTIGAAVRAASCAQLNNCNGNGACDAVRGVCQCYNGWGSATDVALYKAPDCSMRVCPSDRAWFDIPSGPNTAHAVAECSNAGLCDRSTGKCRCFAGYEGEACQRSACPGTPACSGHGKCVSMKQMATEANAVPFGGGYSYGGNEATTTWDENKIYGCVCDSAWEVGYGYGQTQLTQYFGADCSQKHCASGDDPYTTAVDETNCEYYDANGAIWRGYVGSDGNRYVSVASMPAGVTPSVLPAPSTKKYGDASTLPGDVPNAGGVGNKCHVECSRRGKCNYATGDCTCFVGYFGTACEQKATYTGIGGM